MAAALAMARAARHRSANRDRDAALRDHCAKEHSASPSPTLNNSQNDSEPIHELALALWDTGWYEARMLAPFVDEAGKSDGGSDESVGARFRQLGRVRSRLLSPVRSHARMRGERSSSGAGRRDEFVKRAAFALLASVALHDKQCGR